MKRPTDDVVDPVAAYERVAPFFAAIAQRRQQYLESINALTVARIPLGSRSLLDVGAGDGNRVRQIAEKCGLDEIVLLEPSGGMMKEAVAGARIWKIRAEDLGVFEPANGSFRFDVVTCLWNVLGHIQPARARVLVLGELGRLLSPNGLLFLDVNHRYNVRSYGLFRTAGRFLYDRLVPNETNGDVTVSWNISGVGCRTFGHVFTDREIRRLAGQAGLSVCESVTVDYETGDEKRHSFEGNLFYVLRRESSASDPCNVSQTSSTSASVI
jgi:2-polyprenyl-3-methyl-5-hydroxy-6-metoxy-1,4-benzoquinol methylase